MYASTLSIVAVALLSAAACGSSTDGTEPTTDSEAVTIVALGSYPNRMDGFTASGPAVDSGLVCDAGDLAWLGNTTREGDEFSEADFGDHIAAGEPFEFSVNVDYSCSDGSGVFSVAMDVVFEPATNTQTKTWRITAGTDTYRDLSGTGASEQTPAPDLKTLHTGVVSRG